MNDESITSNGADRRTVLKGIGSTLGAVSLAGCAAPFGGERGNLFRYAQVLPPLSLDPIVADDPWSGQAASLVFQGLYTYDRDLNLVPVLAKGQPTVSEDGRTYTIRLDERARFQHDSAVLAEDVKYSFRPATYEESESPNVWQVEMIESIRTPDRHTVEFTLQYPYPAFEHTLTRAVVPKAVRRGDPEAFGDEKPIGSGPYGIEILKPGRYVVLTEWDDYWGPVGPKVESVKMVPNHAGLSRTMSLKTGQNAIVERVQPKLWYQTKTLPAGSIEWTPSLHSHFVAFNCSDEPTADPKVREAIDYLFTMDDVVDHLVKPSGRRQYTPLPRQLTEAWDLPIERWRGVQHRENTEKAKVLLDEAGVDSWTPKIAVPKNDRMREKLAHTIVHGLRGIGFSKARVQTYSWSSFREHVMSGNTSDYAMYIGSWPGFPDPDTFMYPLFHRRMEGLTNGTYYRNPELMAKIERARKTTNRAERKRLYTEAITTVLEDRVHLPAYTLHNSFGVKDRVQGFRPHPISQFNPQFVSPEGSISLRA